MVDSTSARSIPPVRVSVNGFAQRSSSVSLEAGSTHTLPPSKDCRIPRFHRMAMRLGCTECLYQSPCLSSLDAPTFSAGCPFLAFSSDEPPQSFFPYVGLPFSDLQQLTSVPDAESSFSATPPTVVALGRIGSGISGR